MNPHLRSEKVDTATTLCTIKMRRLYLIRQGVALAFMVFATAAFSDGFQSGTTRCGRDQARSADRNPCDSFPIRSCRPCPLSFESPSR